MSVVTLPWPPKELSPNARVHFHTKARVAKVYREHAYWLTKAAGMIAPEEGDVDLRFHFHPPDKRKRDLDNMLASIKAGVDGIADALEVNDQRFGFWLSREAPVKGGKILVSVMP
jgi:crossover junction endodeoxyribonuclease RusA